MRTLNANTNEIADNWLPSVSAARKMESALLAERLAYARHLLAVNKEQMTKAGTAVADQSAATDNVLGVYEALISSDNERLLMASLREGFAAYRKLGVEMLELSGDNDKEFAKVLFEGEMGAEATKITAAIEELVALNNTGSDAAQMASTKAYNSVLLEVFISIGIAALVLIIAVTFAVRGIARPIQGITGSMTRLAEGDADTAVPYAGRRDEIGEMAGAVEVFRQSALENRRLEADGKEQRALAKAEKVRVAQEAEAAAQARLLQATSGLASGLKRLAAGDLSFQLNEPFAPDFEALRHDLNTAVAQLGQTLLAVTHSAGSIDNGSREISSSSDDLSKRTEQQAASLEETAAALDQITVNVSNSSKRAEEARNVAIQANASAAESGTVVANAVDAMQKIEQSSSQISSIIGVIDEIAFQTNLLALNAGVEAARAGDAGKGFAVVAQEVRELAQRSAKAAKEIKDLIRNSSNEVEGGVRLVRATGEALKTIEQYVITINQHMDAIATSSREQSVGLAEVNTAVNQMDQVTQQNAAMVEETNAASATLAMESSRLRELIAAFQLTGGTQQSSGHRRAA
ncbi:methyl-accepting chemotaxis protein [Pararhizobium antarcticum]|uniref:methyl-accepting chemotaxis protein n=2 Tax=Pararhizobium antarcticum TaxID=1798805 RepID=UPI000B0F0393|nr:methyl-accepting chemotaxis protein [Pararhizobium antarcticum]